MTSISELKHAIRAVRRWCDATGMRENIKKREGLAMGTYRGHNMQQEFRKQGRGIAWAPEKRMV